MTMTRPVFTFSPPFAFFVCFFCVALMLIMQLLGIYWVSLWYFEVPNQDMGDLVLMGSEHGLVVAGSVVVTALFLMAFCYTVIYAKTKNHSSLLEFFAIKSVPLFGFLRHLGIFLVFLVISETLMVVFDKSPMSFMDTLITQDTLIPLVVATTIIAPLYEEVVFRGLIFGTIVNTSSSLTNQPNLLGLSPKEWTATVISSVLFAMVHLQYDVFGMGVIFVIALLLCYARIKYGLLLAIVLHVINNSLAMAMYLYLNP